MWTAEANYYIQLMELNSVSPWQNTWKKTKQNHIEFQRNFYWASHKPKPLEHKRQ